MLIYQDLRIRRRDLFVESTKTTIPLNWSFFKSFFIQFGLFFVVVGFYLLRQVQFTRKRYTIGFYPAQPKPWYKVWNVTRFMGTRYSDDIRQCDVLFCFEDKTHSTLNTDYIGVPNKKVINGYCTDIGKDKVMRVFGEVFGYDLEVDPTAYTGKAVCKSIENAAHDGRIIECPIERREAGVVYQRLIDNSYNGKTVQDIRAPVIGGRIPFVYIKERGIDHRFADRNSNALMAETRDILTDDEAKRISIFCERMGLDYGGLDILRDRLSGKIFVVDVNKTCMGPPVPLTLSDKVRALRREGAALAALIDRHTP